MRQLTARAAAAFHVESSTTAGHVGSLLLLDGDSACDVDAVRDLVELRLPRVPMLTWRARSVPLGLGRPFWVEDPDFDVEFHVRDVTLSEGEDLGDRVGRLHARPVDPRRPLWELCLLHRHDGRPAAAYLKVHLAAVVDSGPLLAELVDTAPEPPLPPLVEAGPADRAPSDVDLLVQGMSAALSDPVGLVRGLPGAFRGLERSLGADRIPGVDVAAGVADIALRFVAGRPVSGPARPPRTPLDGVRTPHRRLVVGSLPLAELDAVAASRGLDVGDICLGLLAGGLRRWLLDRDALPDRPLVAVLDAGDAEVGASRTVPLPTDLPDPEARLRMAAQPGAWDAVAGVRLAGAVAAEVAGGGGESVANLAVSFDAVADGQLYLAGARVDAVYPVAALLGRAGGLGVGFTAYEGSVCYALTACREQVPDTVGLASSLLSELRALAP